MSEVQNQAGEQKEGIVVNPFHKQGAEAPKDGAFPTSVNAAAPQGGEQGNAASGASTTTAASDTSAAENNSGNVQASSEQTSGDATQNQSSTPTPASPTSASVPASGESTSPSDPTATVDTSASDGSSPSTSPAEGSLSGFIHKAEEAVEGELKKVEQVASDVIESVKDAVGLDAAVVEDAVKGQPLEAAKPATEAINFVDPGGPTNPNTHPGEKAAAPANAPTAKPVTLVTGGVVNGNVVTDIKSPAPHTNVLGTQDLSLKAAAPVAAAAPAPAVKAAAPTQTGISEVDQLVDKLMIGASIEAKNAINTIRDYVVKMKPGKPVSVAIGKQLQVDFYKAQLVVLNTLGRDFEPTMHVLLALLHAHKDGAFRETHVFRFIEHVNLSSSDRIGFRKITTLLKTLANPTTRPELLRQISFEPLLRHGLTERGRTQLAKFFKKQ
jgi:hypothetical protein